MRRIYLHALGGGHGHLVRARGLGMALQRGGHDVRIGVPAEREDTRALADRGLELWPLERDSARSVLAERLRRFGSELIVADALPHGVGGELSTVDACTPRVWVRRVLRPEVTRRLAARFAREVDIEPLAPGGFGPVVSPSLVSASAPVVLVGGDDALDRFVEGLADRLRRSGVQVALHLRRAGAAPAAPDPLAPTPLAGARVVVGPAGYHLVHEARALGVHHLAVPRPRRFDDQRLRADRFAERSPSPEALLARLAAIVGGDVPPRPTYPGRSYDELAAEVSRAGRPRVAR